MNVNYLNKIRNVTCNEMEMVTWKSITDATWRETRDATWDANLVVILIRDETRFATEGFLHEF